MSLLDEFELDIECPECIKELTITSSDFGQTIQCPKCKVNITLQDNGISDGLNHVDNMIDDALKGLLK